MDKKVKQLFEYLLALRHLSSEPIRDIRRYDKCLVLDELPLSQGCYIGGSGEDSQAYIEVHQQLFKGDYPRFDLRLGRLFELLKFDYTKEVSVCCPSIDLEEILMNEWNGLKELVASTEDMISLSLWQRFLIQHSAITIRKDELEVKMTDVSLFIKECLDLYACYIESWKQWAMNEKRKRQIQKLYDYFFQLRQELKSEERPLEIMLGIGMLSYQVKTPINHPLLTTKLELDFDAEKGIAKLTPSPKGYNLELEMLSGVEFANQMEIMKLKESISGAIINPFNLEESEGILRQFIHYMHPNGLYINGDDVVSKFPMIRQQNIIFIRQKSEVLLKEDLQTTIDYLSEGGKIPKAIQAIIDVEGLNQSPEEMKEWARIGDQLLFPLPANEEQKDIARRLAHNVAVTVQGPPGTGKSHTIVNLIAHLLAHGKRVLVTSEKDKALRVLLDKIPEELQSLCVSVLGGDRQSLSQIEQSIRTISEGLATYDVKLLEKEIQVLTRQLDMVRRQMSITKHHIVRFKEMDSKGQLWKDRLWQPYEMAQLVSEQSERLGWVNDKVEMDAICSLSEEQFVTLWELKGSLPIQHKELLQLQVPLLSRLLSVEEYRNLLNEERCYVTRIEELKLMPKLYSFDENRAFIDELQSMLHPLKLKLEQLTDKLEQRILEECLLNEERHLVWETIFERLQDLMVQINEHEVLIVNDLVECSYYNHPKYEGMMQSLTERIQSGKNIGGLYLTFNSDIRAFYENTRVNGHKISTLDDLKRIALQKEKNDLLAQFANVWNKTMGPNGGDFIEVDANQVLFAHNQKMKKFELILDCVARLNSLNEFLLPIVEGYKEITYENLSDLKALAYSIELTKNKMKQKGWADVYNVMISKYKPLLLGENMHHVAGQLYEAMVDKNHELFAELLGQLQVLSQVKEQYVMFETLLHELKVSMPLFANDLLNSIGVCEPIPGSLSDIFDYAKLTTFLDGLEDWKSDELQLKLEMLEKEEVSLIKQLIFKMTWKNQLDRVTPEEDRALQTWMQKVNRIGKGSGRLSQKFRKEARAEMEKCQRAIPVWIMPVKEAIENFKVDPDLFDVVIIDESSQCNVLSLPVLMRAKKVVVVGDDQQISPMMPGISDAQVKDLMARYLYDIENGNSYDFQLSLYDIACRVFSSKGKLMLKEHFRCVPEIIGFSNGLAYHNEMIPLKLPIASEQFNPAVMAVYVEDGLRDEKKTNFNEAKRIVEDMAACIKNPAYVGKSMGVISLLGSDQAKLIQKLLLDAVGERVMVERQIICGDAYSFQGDERDVMFLSLVIAPNSRYNALNKKMYTQRFNVAATRARCQMRLYHSVMLSELSAEDLRYELLAYCQHPKPMFELSSSACETLLEQDLMQAISERGYCVKPKVTIGKYQVDLVVEGERQRLAIECDGDTFYGVEKIEQEIERQRILERVGWHFVHIRGSVFYRNKEKALQLLWQQLDELGIEKE